MILERTSMNKSIHLPSTLGSLRLLLLEMTKTALVTHASILIEFE
jgi:hypothetical protein